MIRNSKILMNATPVLVSLLLEIDHLGLLHKPASKPTYYLIASPIYHYGVVPGSCRTMTDVMQLSPWLRNSARLAYQGGFYSICNCYYESRAHGRNWSQNNAP